MKRFFIATATVLALGGTAHAQVDLTTPANGGQGSAGTDNDSQAAIAHVGKDVFNRCKGRIVPVQSVFFQQDPYATVGKCFSMELPQFLPPNLGWRQWRGPNALLESHFFGEMSYTFFLKANEHIQIGKKLVAIGITPIQYQSRFRVVRTPMTFRVLRFY